MNNKGRRNELTKLKWKKRLNQLGMTMEYGIKHRVFVYKTTGRPCSCFICKRYRERLERAKIKALWRKNQDTK